MGKLPWIETLIATEINIRQTSSASIETAPVLLKLPLLPMSSELLRKSKGCDGTDRESETYQGKNLTWGCSSRKKKTSYVSSLIAKQGNMDEFREIQSNLCGGHDCGNEADEEPTL